MLHRTLLPVVLWLHVPALPGQSPALAMPFTDVSAAAGILDSGISFGAAAGDANDDGWVDIFTGGHYLSHPHLWINRRNGTFSDGTHTMVPYPNGDMHGAQWTDLDNDGRQELVLLRGANYGLTPTPKFAYRRFGNQLTDIAPLIGLDLPLMRARTPLAVDMDGNGRTDLFMTAVLRLDGLFPSGPYLQQPGNVFSSGWPAQPFLLGSDSQFGVLGDLDGDRRLDLLLQAFPIRAFRFDANGFTDITPGLGLPPSITLYDAAVADLNGDGENEIYLARAPLVTSFHAPNPQELLFHPILALQEHGVRFPVQGKHLLTVGLGPTTSWPPNTVFIGAHGYNPSSFDFVLDPNDPRNAGVPPHVPGLSYGIRIGWDPATGSWSMALSSPLWAEAMLRVTATAPIGAPVAFGWNPNAALATDVLLERTDCGAYQDHSAIYGLPAGLRSRSVVAGDFDNDMDQDLYLVTATTSNNTPNVMLRNDGLGNFQAVPCGAAVGSTRGIGDSAITLDYDRDGDLDLFVVNGDGSAYHQGLPNPAFADDGPAQLLRNDNNNGNHWLQLKLVGTASNRDGIGARIEVTAGGVVQVREHGGGMHRFSQNHGIHFGLGQNTTVAQVRVLWPNGSQSVRTTVAADQLLTITQ